MERKTNENPGTASAGKQNKIRILIVDDDGDDLAFIAEKVLNFASAFYQDAGFEIELSENAHWAANIVSTAPPGESWDIILSDVFMPEPKKPNRRPEELVTKTTQGEFILWMSPPSGLYSPDHGGYRIADAIIRRLKRESTWKPPRLALVSSWVKSAPETRERMAALLREGRGWLDYFDKAIEVDSGNELKLRGFLWCLRNALADIKSETYGLPVVDFHGELRHAVAMTANSRQPWLELRGLTSRPGSKVLIEGETGTGKRFAAEAIAAENKTSPDEPSVIISSRQLSAEGPDQISRLKQYLKAAHEKVLLVLEVQDLPPKLQTLLYTFLDEELLSLDDRPPIRWRPRLAILTETFQPSAQAAVFNLPVALRAKIPSVKMPPLRERLGDLQEFFFYAKERSQHPFKSKVRLSQSALNALEVRNWENNLDGFIRLIDNVLAGHQTEVIDAEDIESEMAVFEFVGSNGYPPVIESVTTNRIPIVDVPITDNCVKPEPDAIGHPVSSIQEREGPENGIKVAGSAIHLDICNDSFHIKVNWSDPILLRRMDYILICALRKGYEDGSSGNLPLASLGAHIVAEGNRLWASKKCTKSESWFKKAYKSPKDPGNSAYDALQRIWEDWKDYPSDYQVILSLLPTLEPKAARNSGPRRNVHWGFRPESVEFGSGWFLGT